MAYRKKTSRASGYRSRGSVSRRRPAKRRSVSRGRKSAGRTPQTVKIVVQMAQPAPIMDQLGPYGQQTVEKVRKAKF